MRSHAQMVGEKPRVLEDGQRERDEVDAQDRQPGSFQQPAGSNVVAFVPLGRCLCPGGRRGQGSFNQRHFAGPIQGTSSPSCYVGQFDAVKPVLRFEASPFRTFAGRRRMKRTTTVQGDLSP